MNNEIKNITIFNQRMAGYLMQKGYVLIDMRPDMKSGSRKMFSSSKIHHSLESL